MRTLFFVFCFASFSNAQVIGEIFDKDFANQEFGKVVSSVNIDNSILDAMLKVAGEYIMLNIDGDKLAAIDKDRKSVSGLVVKPEEVFYKMSTSQVELLIKKGGKKSTIIQMRPKTLTLTNGDFTLERASPCPPDCG